MQEFLQQVISGVASGGIFASLALALVLIYNAMGLVNFAQGEMAMMATFIAFSLITRGVSYWIAFPVTLAIAFAGGIAIQRIVIRPVERAPLLTLVIITLGLATLLNGLAGAVFGYVPRSFPSPFSVQTVDILGAFFSFRDLGVITVSAAVLLLIYLLLQRTTVGLTMRAAAHHPEASRLLGVRVSWMLALGWGLASAVGAVSGIMVAPIILLEPNMMQTIIIYAFAAAVLGGIESPLGAVIGGLIVGVTVNLAGAYLPFVGGDLQLAVALAIIIGVLVLKPNGLLGRPTVRRV
jgi:branched-chain amino acid transport system permease protein